MTTTYISDKKPIIATLPEDALSRIFYFLPFEDLATCAGVCRVWRTMSLDATKERSRQFGKVVATWIRNADLDWPAVCSGSLRFWCIPSSFDPDGLAHHLSFTPEEEREAHDAFYGARDQQHGSIASLYTHNGCALSARTSHLSQDVNQGTLVLPAFSALTKNKLQMLEDLATQPQTQGHQLEERKLRYEIKTLEKAQSLQIQRRLGILEETEAPHWRQICGESLSNEVLLIIRKNFYFRLHTVLRVFNECLSDQLVSLKEETTQEALLFGFVHLSTLTQFPLPEEKWFPCNIFKIAQIYHDNMEVNHFYHQVTFNTKSVILGFLQIGDVHSVLRLIKFFANEIIEMPQNEFFFQELLSTALHHCPFLPQEGEPIGNMTDESRALLRRHLIVFMNRIGYILPNSLHYPDFCYWTMNRREKYRIECYGGYAFDQVASQWMHGHTREAQESAQTLLQDTSSPEKAAHVLYHCVLRFARTLPLSDHLRGENPKLPSEMTCQDLLSFLEDLIRSIPEATRTEILRHYLAYQQTPLWSLPHSPLFETLTQQHQALIQKYMTV